MAKTFRATGRFRTSQSLADTAPYSDGLRAAPRAADCPNAPTLGKTESGLDWGPRDPARTAHSDGSAGAVARNYQARVTHASLGWPAARCVFGVFSETLADGRPNAARHGLDLSLSRSGSQRLRLSH